MIHSAPRHARMRGTLISTPIDGGPVVVSDTVQCVHCSRIWKWQVGSGKWRGFCLACNGFTCGTRRCDACVPIEQRLENMEAGRPLDYRPIRVSLSGL